MTVRAMASTRSRSRGDADSHLPAFSLHDLAGDLAGEGAHGGQRRQHLQRPQPHREALDLLLDDPLGAAGLALTDLAVAVGHRLQVVDVIQRDALDLGAGGIDVAGNGQVDQQQRAAVALLMTSAISRGLEQEVRRGGRGDDDVGPQQRLGQLVEGRRWCRRSGGPG